ncbi:MAG: hypothetical protein ABEI99_10915, partial [Halobaculum sp.]
PVVGSHHKQRDTIKQWVDLDGDVFEQAMDDLVSNPTTPVVEKGRGTVQLTSVYDAKEFVREHDESGEYSWYL